MSEAARSRPRGTTRVAGVLGWPVSHSLSPAIHNAAFLALGLEWVYVPFPVPPGRVAEALGGLRALGVSGANVTMPHKTEVAELVDALSDTARRLRSVNTIVAGSGGLAGHNTDAPGFDRFLRRDAGFDPAGRTALVFGAGGAARAVALALARGGLEALTVAVRDPTRTESLREALEGFETRVDVVPLERGRSLEADLIVNATPLGAAGEALPVPPFAPEVLVVDLLYGSGRTPLMAAAREAGCAAYGGIGLLLHQAALSFELWTGQPAPLAVMSAAALAEAGDAALEGDNPEPDPSAER